MLKYNKTGKWADRCLLEFTGMRCQGRLPYFVTYKKASFGPQLTDYSSVLFQLLVCPISAYL